MADSSSSSSSPHRRGPTGPSDLILHYWSGRIPCLTSGRDLLRLAVKQAPQSPATIVSDPEYGMGRYVCLVGTVAEADGIIRHFPGVQTPNRSRATKAILVRIAAPAVLHIATHGFYNRPGGSTPAATPATTIAQRFPALAELGINH